MDTARCAWPPEQLVSIDDSDCWIEPCRTCREIKAAWLRTGCNERTAEFYRSVLMQEPLRRSELKVCR